LTCWQRFDLLFRNVQSECHTHQHQHSATVLHVNYTAKVLSLFDYFKSFFLFHHVQETRKWEFRISCTPFSLVYKAHRLTLATFTTLKCTPKSRVVCAHRSDECSHVFLLGIAFKHGAIGPQSNA